MSEHPHGAEPTNPATAVPEHSPDMVAPRPRASRATSSPARRPRRRCRLALQGGGAHGSFTWGVSTP